MSSGISIDEARPVEAGFSRPDRGPASRPDDRFHAWHFFVLGSLLLASVAVVLTRRSAPEHLILLSFTVGAAGAVAAAFYRMLLPLIAEMRWADDGPLTERRRAALERDKTLVLRTIKELEFDRAMDKLSQKDFEEMSGRLRRRALALMKQLDEGIQYREIIEKDLRERQLGRLKPAPTEGGESTEDGEFTEDRESGRGRLPRPEHGRGQPACPCGTINDTDAVFCKKCGARLQAG